MESFLQHQSSPFSEELVRLRAHALKMGGIVESQVLGTIEIHETCDIDRVPVIVENDHQVNLLEKMIDDECAQLIARRQPTAFDLRLVFGITKIVTDLERIGDEAKKIAKAVRRVCQAEQKPPCFSIGIRHIAEASLKMVRSALDAFARLDVSLAESVIQADESVDHEFKGIIRQMITHMMEDPRTISTSLDVIVMARNIERIGDHAKNIAEHVIFIVEGRDVRHLGSQPTGGES